jgi:hypothetical protein
MLKFDWYTEDPIDFEHKNYVLLSYLQEIDGSFSQKKLSPYLLYTETLVFEMKKFLIVERDFRQNFPQKIIGFTFKEGIKREEFEMEPTLKEIIEIVDYSIPLLEGKVKMGYLLLRKYPQILF